MSGVVAEGAPAFHLGLGELGADGDLPADSTRDHDREVLRLMADAARAEPHDPDYYHILGEALLRAGKVQEALRASREAVERDPLSAEYRFALGCALWRAGEAGLAERAFREAVQRRPGDPRTLSALGAALVRLRRRPEAVSTLEKALRIDPRAADTHSNLGAALWGAGDRPGAVRRFRRAVRLDPEHAELHRNLALALGALGRPRKAAAVLRKAIQLFPTRADLRLDLAEAFHQAGRPAEAMRALDEAQRLDPAAISQRPRSREIRDVLRLRAVKGDIARERRSRKGLVSLVSDGALDLLELVGDLRPRVKVLSGLTLLATLALGWLAWHLAPPYVIHYLVQDDIVGVARAPVRDDDVVRERLRRAVNRRGLQDLVDTDRCEVATEPGWRRITCDYTVRIQVLPGVWRALRLRIDVEEPYLADPDPLIL